MVIINKLYPQVIKVCRPLILEDEVLKVLAKKFFESICKSLIAEKAETSSVKCNQTFITDFPEGTEKGCYIGLEFSGRIFRLAEVGLKGNRSVHTISRLYEFPEQRLSGNISKVVDYVAKCVNNFIESNEIMEKKIILGVCSSFPMEQESLTEGIVADWGKSFQCNDGRNQDFFKLLKMSLKKFKYTKKIYLISLISNSTACLMSGMYKDPGLKIGLYLGEDSNLTYVEKYKNMTTFTSDGLRPRTALSVEMKSFGDDGSLDVIRTEHDYQIDVASTDPGKFVFEKMVSAAYLGEVARLVLYKLCSMEVILNGYLSPGLSMKDGLKTSDLAMMEMDDENKFLRCRAVMNNLGYKKVSDEDCVQIRFVCRCVTRRSSNLVAACMTAMLHKTDTKEVKIIGDGWLLKEFPNYESYLLKKIDQLKKPDMKCLLTIADKEESAIGAGLVAYIYKDYFIKLEDKHRSLPAFNTNKYEIPALPSSLIECNCEPVKARLVRSSRLTESRNQIPSTPAFSVFDFAEPVFVGPE